MPLAAYQHLSALQNVGHVNTTSGFALQIFNVGSTFKSITIATDGKRKGYRVCSIVPWILHLGHAFPPIVLHKTKSEMKLHH